MRLHRLPEWNQSPQFGVLFRWSVFSSITYPRYGMVRYGPPNYRASLQTSPELAEWHSGQYGVPYEGLAENFTARYWNAERVAQMVAQMGASYLIFPAMEQDQFALWPRIGEINPPDDWNATTIGPRRDLVGEMATAAQRNGLHFGIYYYIESDPSIQELYALVCAYRPDIIWFDGAFQSDQNQSGILHFIAWLYNYSPVRDTVVINDRFGNHTRGQYGDVVTYKNKWIPRAKPLVKWEHVRPSHSGWGYYSNLRWSQWLSPRELRRDYGITRRYEGNFLLAFGPNGDGLIADQEVALMQEAKRISPGNIDYRKKVIEWTENLLFDDIKTLYFRGEDDFRKRLGLTVETPIAPLFDPFDR